MSAKKPARPKKSAIPPAPRTGGTHVWNSSLNVWETVQETLQPDDPLHPRNLKAAPKAAVEPAVKDA